jgi:hypothetical protein
MPVLQRGYAAASRERRHQQCAPGPRLPPDLTGVRSVVIRPRPQALRSQRLPFAAMHCGPTGARAAGFRIDERRGFR